MSLLHLISAHVWFVIGIFITSLITPLLHILVVDNKHHYRGQIIYTILRYSLFFNIGCFFLLRAVEHIMQAPTIITSTHLGGTPYAHMIWVTELALAIFGFSAGLFNHHFWLATISMATFWNGGSALYHLVANSVSGAHPIVTSMWLINLAISLWTPLLYILWLLAKPVTKMANFDSKNVR